MNPPTLNGQRVQLRPLQREDRAALLDAAADGELWSLNVTVVPNEDTIDRYLDTAFAGRDAGTVMPFMIVRTDDNASSAARVTGRSIA